MDWPVRATTAENAAAPERLSLRDVFKVWTHISIVGIGGPALQITTMHRLFVEERRWISKERFFHALSYCIAMPGPETQQLAVYIGWLAHRMIGGIIAGGLFILPGVICMMALSVGYVTGADSQIGQAIFLGVKPAILAIMTDAILRFGKTVLPTRSMIAIAALAFVAAFLKAPFPIIVIVAALLGLLAAMAGLPGFARAAPVDNADDMLAEAELPDHTRPSTANFVRSILVCLVLWFAPVVLLLVLLGPANIFTQISLLFSKVAVMSIGGDYAVIAYAAQQVVDSYHWISAREMQEAIAMGEMVPGTIMIVTQFLGFLAAYRDPGVLSPLWAGIFGGLIATWATFTPCFLWILVLAPFIEGLRESAFLSGPLRAVTAAAVGMIVNLSVWFGIRTIFSQVIPVQFGWLSFDVPNFSSLEPWAFVLFVFAAIAVLRYKLSSIATLALSSIAGTILLLSGVAVVQP